MSLHADVIWAIVPVKDFACAKGRLAAGLSPATRAGLARAMAEDVLAALQSAKVAERLCVLSDSPAVHELAVRAGATWLDENSIAAARGLNGAITGAARFAAAEGATALLVVHADLPLLTAASIQRVVDTWHRLRGKQRVVLARSHDGGTNIFLAERPQAFTYRYGVDSYARHLHECARRRRAVANVEMPGTVLDIDTLADLEQLKDAARAGNCGSHTAALLANLTDRHPEQMESAP